MTGPATFLAQRRIGDELLACGWHASAIATETRPGSAWSLIDPSRRIRVRMSADFAAPRATITATVMPSTPETTPAWSMVIDFASSPAIVAAALMAASAGTPRFDNVAERRKFVRALESIGMHPNRSRIRRALTGCGAWRTDDGRARATWTAPRRTDDGGWHITMATLRLEAAATTPAAVLTAILSTSAAQNTREDTP
jgi:hypothetical protein